MPHGFAGRLGILDTAAPADTDLVQASVHVAGDVRDTAAVARALTGVDLVFHLAGVADPRACEHDPVQARAVNVAGTAAVVAAARGRRLMLLSSAAVYAPSTAPLLDEHAAVSDANVYAATKLAAEALCLEATQAGRLGAIVVRNFNTYGAAQAPVFLVPQLIDRGVRQGRVEVASCRPIRDFTYIDDVVTALIALGMRAAPGEIFNLGTGRGTSVGDVALMLGRQLGVPVSCANTPVGGNPAVVADNAKLAGATGWEPCVSLEDGLARTVEWFRRQSYGPVVGHTS